MIFSDDTLSSLQPIAGRRYTVRCESTPGFTAKVSTSGEVTLWHECVRGGRKIRTKLGVYPSVCVEASRARCCELSASTPSYPTAKRIAPQIASTEPPDRVLSAHIEAYRKHHMSALSHNTQTLYAAMLKLIAGHYPSVEHITPQSVRRAMDSMRSTPVKANRYLAVLSTLCKYMVERGVIEYNPAACITRYKEKPVQDYMTDEQLAALGGYIRSTNISFDCALAIRIILVTGCRVSEVCGMTYQEIGHREVRENVWTVPASRTKSGRDFVTFIPDRLCADAWFNYKRRGARKEDNVFLCRPSSVSQAVRRLCASAGIPEFSCHDLRRTVGTILARDGVSPDIRSRFLNHAATGVTDRHYNVYDYSAEKLEVSRMLVAKMEALGIL